MKVEIHIIIIQQTIPTQDAFEPKYNLVTKQKRFLENLDDLIQTELVKIRTGVQHVAEAANGKV